MRYGFNPILFILNNGGYTVEVEIHDGPYNVIQNWDYAKLLQVFDPQGDRTWSAKVRDGESAGPISVCSVVPPPHSHAAESHVVSATVSL